MYQYYQQLLIQGQTTVMDFSILGVVRHNPMHEYDKHSKHVSWHLAQLFDAHLLDLIKFMKPSLI